MKKWLDNYNDVKISTPEGYVGEGTSNKGRNYSPAWGGQFQNGGISQFLKKPFQLQSQTNTVSRDNTNVNNQKARTFKQLNVRNKTDKEIAQEREARIQASVEAQKVPYTKENWRQQLAAETSATGDKLRISNEPNFFDDYLNPVEMVGSMASNLGQAPLQAEQSDSVLPYVTSVGVPLFMGAVGGLGAKTTAQFTNNMVNPLAGTGDLVNNLGNKYLPNAYKLNPLANKEAYNTLYHNTNNLNFSLEDVDLLRQGSSQMKSKYANRDPNLNPSGFYTTDNPNAVFMGGSNTYSMQIPKNAKIADLKAVGRTTDRVSRQELLDLQKEGYDIIRGKNMLGLDEYIPLNKSKISNWENLGERVKDPSKSFQKDIYQYEQPDWLQGYKKIQKQENGGITKDDNGYWNPDNWGKPVEIGNNDITMEGVDQDLIGISDEGDVQYMTPGNNYKFKGKKVTEFPVAKEGSELKKLDQLTNFSNYNTKQRGGWLDKFN